MPLCIRASLYETKFFRIACRRTGLIFSNSKRLGTWPMSLAHCWIMAITSSLLTAFSCKQARYLERHLWSAAALGCGDEIWVLAFSQIPMAKSQSRFAWLFPANCQLLFANCL